MDEQPEKSFDLIWGFIFSNNLKISLSGVDTIIIPKVVLHVASVETGIAGKSLDRLVLFSRVKRDDNTDDDVLHLLG